MRAEWQQVKKILDRALEIPSDARPEFLVEACNDDQALHDEVLSFLELESEELAHTFIEKPAFSIHTKQQTRTGETVGPYLLGPQLGVGGMGTVYVAERAKPFQQRVAIKILKRGMDTDAIQQRFHLERQILANLQHPWVASILDGGTTQDNLPYFAMEFVEGQPIDSYCDQQRLTVRQRLELFSKVCQAVHFAHQSLVVHRDLKPGNIMVTPAGEPKLLDFGIAKILDPAASSTLMTEIGRKAMTPEYASPEQLRGETVTTATDIFSLGILLYQLLTGHSPFRSESRSPADLESRAHTQTEPPRPSSIATERLTDQPATAERRASVRRLEPRELKRKLRGDLDNIVLKAMAQRPSARYSSVEKLVEDIQRHLDGRPVLAREATLPYRTSRFLRRNWLPVSVAATFMAMTTSFGIWEAHRSQELEQALMVAEEQRAISDEVVSFLTGVFDVSDSSRTNGEQVTARQLLSQAAKELDNAAERRHTATLRAAIGAAHSGLALYDPARELLEGALRSQQNQLVPDDPNITKTMTLLANLESKTGHHPQALNWSEQILARQQKSFAADSAQVLEARSNRVTHAQAARKISVTEAEKEYRTILHIYRQHQDLPLEITTPLQNLAALLRKDRPEEAIDYYQQALTIREQHGGQFSRRYLRTKRNLAVAFRSVGRYEEAESLVREVVEVQSGLHAEPHDQVAMAHYVLASVLHDQGNLEPAIDSYRQALSVYDATVGRNRDYVIALNNLGLALAEHGEPRLGLEACQQAETLQGQQDKPLASLTAVIHRNLAALECDAGDPDVGMGYLERVEAWFQRKAHYPRWSLADHQSLRGNCLLARGQLAEALALLKAGYDGLLEANVNKPRQIRQAKQRLLKAGLSEPFSQPTVNDPPNEVSVRSRHSTPSNAEPAARFSLE